MAKAKSQNIKKRVGLVNSRNILSKNGFVEDVNALFTLMCEIDNKLGEGFFDDIELSSIDVEDFFASAEEETAVRRVNTLLNAMAEKICMITDKFSIIDFDDEKPFLSSDKRNEIARINSMLHNLLEKNKISKSISRILFAKINALRLSKQEGYGFNLNHESVFPIFDKPMNYPFIITTPLELIEEHIEFLKLIAPPTGFKLKKALDNGVNFDNHIPKTINRYGTNSDEYKLAIFLLRIASAYVHQMKEEILKKDKKADFNGLGLLIGQNATVSITLEDMLDDLFCSTLFSMGIDVALKTCKFEHEWAVDLVKWAYAIVLIKVGVVSIDFVEFLDSVADDVLPADVLDELLDALHSICDDAS